MRGVVLTVLLLAGSLPTAEAYPTDGLSGHWKLDEASGTVVSDSSGRSNHGILRNADPSTAWAPGLYGGAVDLDGQNDYAEIPHSSTLASSRVTVAAWVRFDAFRASGCDHSFVAAKGHDRQAGSYRLFAYDIDACAAGTVPRAAFALGPFTSGIGATGVTPLLANRWYHLAGTYDGSTVRVYVDGSLDASWTGSVGVGVAEPLLLGRHGNVNFPYLTDGRIDDVHVYDRALSMQEIQLLKDRSPVGTIGYHLEDFEGFSLGTYPPEPAELVPEGWTFLTEGAVANEIAIDGSQALGGKSLFQGDFVAGGGEDRRVVVRHPQVPCDGTGYVGFSVRVSDLVADGQLIGWEMGSEGHGSWIAQVTDSGVFQGRVGTTADSYTATVPGFTFLPNTWYDVLGSEFDCAAETFRLSIKPSAGGPTASVLVDDPAAMSGSIGGPHLVATVCLLAATSCGPNDQDIGDVWFDNLIAPSAGTRPYPPADLVAEPDDVGTSVQLAWAPPTDPGTYPVTAYRIYGGDSPALDEGDLLAQQSGTSYVDAGVGFSATRFYQVRAVNALGQGPAAPAQATTPDPVPPLAPRDPATAPGPGPGGIAVTWKAPLANVGPRVSLYSVHRASDPAGPFEWLGDVPAPRLAYEDTPPGGGSTWHYRIVAWNSHGPSPPSATVAGRAEAAPGAPRALAAAASGASDVLAWRAPLGDGGLPVLEYKAYASTAGSAPVEVGSAPGTSRTLAVPACAACEYHVTARNAAGTSLPSNLASPASAPWPPESIRGNTPGAGAGLAALHRCAAAGGSVNLATGQFVSSVCLARLASPLGLDVEVVATHRSHSAASSVLGQGWDLSVLRRLDADGQDMLLLDGQGREDRFAWDAVLGDYVAPPGFYVDLERLAGGAHELHHPGGLVESFAADGRRTEVRDAVGNSLLFRYDLQGRPFEAREPAGRSVFFQYGDRGLAAINDAAGRTTALTIDAAGDLAAIAPEAARPTLEHRFTYTARHDLATATDPEGRRHLENHYDALGRVDWQEDGDGRLTVTYDPARSTTTVTTPQGKVSWQYDAQGVATAKTEWTDRDVRGNEPPSYVTTFTSNAHGELTAIGWPDGRHSEWTHDSAAADPRARGNVLSYREVPSDGGAPREWTSTYEAAYQLPRAVTGPLGNADGYVPPNGGPNSPERHTTTFWYGHDEAAQGDLNGDGQVGGPAALAVRIEPPEVNPDGPAHPLLSSGNQERVQLLAYNARGQVVRVTQPDGAVILHDYYEASEAAVSRPLFHLQSRQRLLQDGALAPSAPQGGEGGDVGLGDLVPIPLPPGPGLPQPVADLAGTLLDPLPGGPVAASAFDAGDGPVEAFEYDEAGQVVLAVDPNGRSTTWAYDDLGRVAQVRSPGEGAGADYTYDGRGNLVAAARLNARQASDGTYVLDAGRPALVDRFAYDAAGNLVERRLNVTGPGGEPAEAIEQFAYDGSGRLVLHRRHDAVTGADPDAVTTYLYNERGQLVATTEGGYTDAFARHAGDGLGLAGVAKTTALYLRASVQQVASCPANADLERSQACRQAPAGDCPGGANGTVVNGRALCRLPSQHPVALDGLAHVGDLPGGRMGASAVWDPARGLAYVLGGSSQAAVHGDIVAYSPQTQEARVVAHLPSPRWFGAAVFDGEHVYHFGGCTSSDCGAWTAEIVRFDPATHEVAVVGSLPGPLSKQAAVWDGSKAYLFGGCGASCTVTRDILSFDPATGQVAVLPGKLPRAVHQMPAVWTGEKAILFGGAGADRRPVDAIVAFDPATGLATDLGKLPVATSDSAAAWDGHAAYVFGGINPSGGSSAATAAILRYDPADGEMVTMAQRLATTLLRPAAAWTTDSALVFGGFFEGSSRAGIHQYKPVEEAPGAPTGLVATPGPSLGETTLRWQSPRSEGSTSLVRYHVHESSQPGGPYTLAGTAAAPQRHLVVAAGPVGETTYYVVTAENGDLEGPASQEANVANTPVVVEAPIQLCPGESQGAVVAGQPLCPSMTACPAGWVGGVVPATAATPAVPVCASVYGCPAGTAGVFANDRAACAPVPSVCLPATVCPAPGDVVCYLPQPCLHLVRGILAAHAGPDGVGVQLDLSRLGLAGPVAVFVPLGGLPYDPGLPIVDLDPEPPEEPEEPVPDPSWLWTSTMETTPAEASVGKAVPSASQAPAIAAWQHAPPGGYDLEGNVQLVFWAARDPGSAAEPSPRWNARLYDDDVLVASTDPHNGVSFLVKPGPLPQEYRIDLGRHHLNGSRLRLELDLDATPAGRLVLFDHAETPSRLEIGTPVTTTTDYDAGGRPTVTTDASGAQTLHAYDGHGQETSVTTPDGARHDSAHDPSGRTVESVTSGDAGAAEPVELERTRLFHDEAGRVYRVDRAFFDPATGDPLPDGPLFPGDGYVTTLYDHDAAGRIVAVIDDNGGVTRFTYDSLGRLVEQTDAAGNRVVSTHDAKGNVVNRTEVDVDALGAPMAPRTTLFAYDSLDRVIQASDALGRVTRQGYDSQGNLAWTLDALGNRVDFTYDAQERLVQTMRELRAGGNGNGALLGHVNTTQEWDAQGRLVRQADDSGASTTYEYDSFDRLVLTTFADGTNETYAYDGRGFLVARTDANGNTMAQAYDEAGRLVSRTTMGASLAVAQSFAYDGLGRMTRASEGASEIRFAYDSLGNQVQERQGPLLTARTFDGVGNALTLVYPNGRVVSRDFDALRRMAALSDASGALASFTYEGAGRLASRTAGNGVVSSYTYDAAQQVTSIDHGLPGLARPFRFDYAYDGNGNRVQEIFHHAPEWSKAAAYDSLGRLVAFERSNVGGLPSVPDPLEGILPTSLAWTLDGVNEWDALAVLEGGAWANQTRSHDAMHAVEAITSGAAASEYQSDLNGNRMEDGRFNYTWDALNRLREVREADTGELVATYAYDALGRRTVKVVDGETTRYVYDGMNVIEERNGANAVLRQFVHGQAIDQPLLMDAAGARSHYLQDALGSVVGLMDDEGRLVEGYLYDAYGTTVVLQPGAAGNITWGLEDLIAETSALGNPYGFTGQRLDSETGLYYYRARYYDAETGLFLGRDPIGMWGDASNLGNGYTYVANNALRYTDPTGEQTMSGQCHVSRSSCNMWYESQHNGAPTVAYPGQNVGEYARIGGDLTAGTFNPQGCINNEWSDTYQYQQVGRIGECLGLVAAVIELGFIGANLVRSGLRNARFLADDAAELAPSPKLAGNAPAKVVAKADKSKFADYVFKEGDPSGKGKIFRSYGYKAKDSAMLAKEFERQAAKKYADGEYTLGKLDQHGQRVTIDILLQGRRQATGQSTVIKTGWMVEGDHTIRLLTPFAGWA